MIVFTIPGKPRAWQRARLAKRGCHHFTDDKTRTAKSDIAWAFNAARPSHVHRWSGPVRLCVTAYFPIPVNTPKAIRSAMEAGNVWYPHKSDWDNIGKLPSDALNGIAYIDDGQIVDGRVRKYYSARPRIEIEIEELP